MFRWFFIAFLLAATPIAYCADEPPIRFNRDVRPILTDKCFACHGPDALQVAGGLRLDSHEGAVQDAAAIVPGSPEESEVIRRILAQDDDQVMPPPQTHKPLSPADKETLRRWIAQGAPYEPHWAYTAMRLPARFDQQTPRNLSKMIDAIVDARLVDEDVEPVPVADRVTLIRRLAFDLTGIPPTADEVNQFVRDTSNDAYLKLVQRLLDSPRFGERMAIHWLDLVRYADTVGYHGDQDVSQWPYRDYVIDAFNRNLPYDQFVREQLAGDLLPAASVKQQVASGYNRLNQTTEEGGSQAKEYLAIYLADRVRNVSQVFMGATVGCAQCHDHKYDPYTTRDFYSLGAFFADLEEVGVYSARSRPPMIHVVDTDTQADLDRLDRHLADLESQTSTLRKRLLAEQDRWEVDARAADTPPRVTEPVWVDDQACEILSEGIPQDVWSVIQIPKEDRTKSQAKQVSEHFLATHPDLLQLRSEMDQTKAERTRIYEATPQTVVSKSVEPRTIRILPRGNWMDDSGDIVTPAIPQFLGSLDIGQRRATRLDLADWLCQPDNPLTSRTMVNRLWSLLFGRGICASVDDLGGQGTYPSYPELLDALAIEFIQSGWDIKHVMRSIVMSQTYRRSSTPTGEILRHDPYNDLFARQGRFGVDAEMVRDAALSISGLLVEKVGGPSVRPYQPAGYYAQLNFPRREYTADTGDAQYRRGVYTHWQRTFLHPMLKAFDAPSREECTPQRAKSNTPLQALALLNDPTFVEAARVFAARIMAEGGTDLDAKIDWAYRTVVSRSPPEPAHAALLQVYHEHLNHYRLETVSAQQLISVGDAAVEEQFPGAELAAWTSVARILLNLRESITRY